MLIMLESTVVSIYTIGEKHWKDTTESMAVR